MQPVQKGKVISRREKPERKKGSQKKAESASHHHKPMVSKNSKKVTPRSSERIRNENKNQERISSRYLYGRNVG